MTRNQDQNQNQDPQDNGPSPTRRAPGALEWTASGLALLLIATALGYLVWDALQPTRPIVLQVTPGQLERRMARFYQQVEVRNLGSASTGTVQLRGTLRRDGEIVEEVAGQLDTVPADSARSTTLVFREDPGRATLNLDVESYGEP